MKKIIKTSKDEIFAGGISFGLILAISGAIFSIVNLIAGSVSAAKKIDYANSIEPEPEPTFINSNFLQNSSVSLY